MSCKIQRHNSSFSLYESGTRIAIFGSVTVHVYNKNVSSQCNENQCSINTMYVEYLNTSTVLILTCVVTHVSFFLLLTHIWNMIAIVINVHCVNSFLFIFPEWYYVTCFSAMLKGIFIVCSSKNWCRFKRECTRIPLFPFWKRQWNGYRSSFV